MTYLLVSGLLSPMPLESSCRGVFSLFERDSEDTIPDSPIPYMYPTDSALQLRVPSDCCYLSIDSFSHYYSQLPAHWLSVTMHLKHFRTVAVACVPSLQDHSILLHSALFRGTA